ncbi:hypothetical protein HQ560_19740 [bacterium]|nr:hypothetical protein [bacterium]
MRRIVLVAMGAIILPSLVLTLVGLKLTLDLKNQLEQSLADQYATMVRARVKAIETEVEAVEERARREIDGLTPEQTQLLLDAVRRRTPLVEEVFLLQVADTASDVAIDRRLVRVHPKPPPPPAVGSETFLWGEPLPRQAIASGQNGRKPTVDETLQALARYRDRTLSPASRARATQVVAALQFRHGRFPEAVTEYRRLLDADNVAVFSPSVALLARYQIALAERNRGEAWAALNGFLALFDAIVNERTGVSDAGRIRYFALRTREHIDALLAETDAPQPVRTHYKELLREQGTRAARARFFAYLDRIVIPRLALKAASLQPDDEGFHHIDDVVAGEPYVIAYTALHGPEGARQIFGLKLDMDHLENGVFAETLRSNRLGSRVAFVVADQRGTLVYGAATKRAPAASEGFAIFPSWRVALVETAPAELRSLAYRNVYLFAVVTTAMILAIILGTIITLRGTAKELELSRLKSEFVSNVSHELKTPLALIRMFAETLQLGRVRSAEKAAEYHSIITRESERLTQLINNVLDFSRIEGGRKRYDLRLEDIADVVNDTLHAYSYELEKQGFAVETDVPDDLPQTLMDRNAISLALLNLLSNAVKYSGDDRRVRLAVAVTDGRLALSVTDHGIGIDEENLDKVFDKFFRAREEAVTSTRGSGLGLAIVRHSAEAHGGDITVESAPGQGSTFTFTLPIRKTLNDGKDPSR